MGRGCGRCCQEGMVDMDKRDEDLFGFEEEEPRQKERADSEEILTIESFEEEPEPSGDAFDFVEEEEAPAPVDLAEESQEDDELFGADPAESSVEENDTPGWARVADMVGEQESQAQPEEEPVPPLFAEEEADGTFEGDEADGEEAPGQSRRLLVLVLLLVLAAAAAGWFLMTTGEKEPAQVAVSGKMPIQPPPAPPREEQKVATETVAPKPVAAVGQQQAAEQKQAASGTGTPAGTGEAFAGSEKQVPAAPAKPVPVAVPAKPTGAAGKAKQEIPDKPAAGKEPSPQVTRKPAETGQPADKAVSGGQSAAGGGYLVRAGAFMLPANLDDALKKVRKLGLEPRVESVPMTRPMVRLRYGIFSKTKAPAELARLKKKAPSAFVIYHDDKGEIFAGSFVSLDKARRYADILWEKHQLRLEEVRAEVAVPVRRVSVGPLKDRVEAGKVAEKLKKAGLEGAIVKSGK
ncbi:MAG: SPOR domain-containing protein [Deltaproteobacteria bacterium]|nr:MAG: SPOR domain-containing protein [Deltaproteobacteria bacterium]